MYSEKTTLVGVKKDGGYLKLTTPSKDLYVAAKSGDVLLQWQTYDEYDGVTTKYARLTEAFWDGNEHGNYSFKFDNGETYIDDGDVPASYETDEDEPASNGGGTGGGVLVVHMTQNNAKTNNTRGPVVSPFYLDKTYQEIIDAGFAVLFLGDTEAERGYASLARSGYNEDDGYFVVFVENENNLSYFANSSTSTGVLVYQP